MTKRKFERGDLVQYTDTAISRMPEQEQRRFKGRIGQVAGYRGGATEPFVDFPRFGRFKEVRFYELDSRLLEPATLAPVAPSSTLGKRPTRA